MNIKKVALITGANKGIGFETAKQLGEQGITVVITSRTLEAAQKAAELLKAQDVDAYAIQLDVTKESDRLAVAFYISEKFGKLDILINNAGIAPKETLFANRTIETTEEEFQQIFSTNFFSIVLLTKVLLPLLKASPAGRIVNLSSILGSLGVHSAPESPLEEFRVLSYNASKAALNVFTIHLAAELKGTNIKVNSAHPGWVKTELGGEEAAPMDVTDGAKTSVALALIENDGPNGKFIHLGEELPW